MFAALVQSHALAAPPTPTPLPPPTHGEEGIDCAGWGVIEGRVRYLNESEDCPMPPGAGGLGTCEFGNPERPKITACATGTSFSVIDYLRAIAEVKQGRLIGMFGPPCPCEGDSPTVGLVGKRSSVIYSLPGNSGGARKFNVKTKGAVRLKSELDITADCLQPSCASVNGVALWRMSIPLTNPEAERELQLNGIRLERVTGIGFCTSATQVSGGFEIGPAGVGAQWGYDVGGTVARGKKVQNVTFNANFCIGADAAEDGLEFWARGEVLGQATLSRGTLAYVRTEVELYPIKIDFAAPPGSNETVCGSCAPDSPWSMPASSGQDGEV